MMNILLINHKLIFLLDDNAKIKKFNKYLENELF
jgi:hypothetical protein